MGLSPAPKPRVDAPELSRRVREQTHDFERAAVEQGLLGEGSARTYRKALECLAKQAERKLGRPRRLLELEL